MSPTCRVDSVILTVDAGQQTTSKRGWHPLNHLEHLLGWEDARRLIHGMKVGISIVLVSLLYILDALHDRLGDNSMWAIVTVVVMFRFTSGATIQKGLNRCVGTICGGGMGIMLVLWPHRFNIGEQGRLTITASGLFIICTAASYFRMIPCVKKKYDHGVMFFIMIFSLVSVFGVRNDDIVKQANDLLASIFIGITISIIVNVLVFPVWAADQLHASLDSNLNCLASSIEENVKEYFRPIADKLEGRRSQDNFKGCKSVIYSKATDESMIKFAKWECRIGRFGLKHCWDDYLVIGNLISDLAIFVLSLRSCRKSKYPAHSVSLVEEIKTQCEAIGNSVGSIMRKLGDHLIKRTRCDASDHIGSLEYHSHELTKLICHLDIKLSAIQANNSQTLGFAQTTQFMLILGNIIDRLEELLIKVEKLEISSASRKTFL
ncbi:hypothetical protein ZOSMA_8G00460 [Zostera marina]|uniref:Aluminum-activated malate transporter n=1 Tax=Zostera marina TaxID=29655 RepID=A0A0K9NLE3_ZOSMR|nr:hypothetical protein ZOSMA_8G00460 [Zostera marina]